MITEVLPSDEHASSIRKRPSSLRSSARDTLPKSPPRAWVKNAIDSVIQLGIHVDTLKDLARELVVESLREQELRMPASEGLNRQVDRLAAMISLHLLKHRNPEANWKEAVDSLRVGRLGSRKVQVDLIAETVLVEAVSQRDPQAMALLLTAHAPTVSRVARAAGGLRAEQELDGLIVDIIQRPERYLDGFRGQSELSAWISTIVRSAWVNRTRSEARETRHLNAFRARFTDIPTQSDEFASSDQDDYEGCEQQLQQIAAQALGVLTGRESLMVRMIMLDGLTQAEFARRMGCDKATITRWMAGVRNKLARRVSELLSESGRETILIEYLDLTLGSPDSGRPTLASSAVSLLTRFDDSSAS